MLDELGCRVVGPFSDARPLLQAAGKEATDVALLDVDLKEGRAYLAAQKLIRRAIPVAFVAGHSNLPDCPSSLEDVPRLLKPFGLAKLRRTLLGLARPLASRS